MFARKSSFERVSNSARRRRAFELARALDDLLVRMVWRSVTQVAFVFDQLIGEAVEVGGQLPQLVAAAARAVRSCLVGPVARVDLRQLPRAARPPGVSAGWPAQQRDQAAEQQRRPAPARGDAPRDSQIQPLSTTTLTVPVDPGAQLQRACSTKIGASASALSTRYCQPFGCMSSGGSMACDGAGLAAEIRGRRARSAAGRQPDFSCSAAARNSGCSCRSSSAPPPVASQTLRHRTSSRAVRAATAS